MRRYGEIIQTQAGHGGKKGNIKTMMKVPSLRLAVSRRRESSKERL
jgi:hypothetical protein